MSCLIEKIRNDIAQKFEKLKDEIEEDQTSTAGIIEMASIVSDLHYAVLEIAGIVSDLSAKTADEELSNIDKLEVEGGESNG